MSNIHKSKQYDLIDMFNDIYRYLDDIFTIDNPEFEKYFPDIYQTKFQLNKANTSDKETSFLDLNIKVIGSDVHISVYDNSMTSDFLSSIIPGWVVMFLDFHRMAFTFLSWFDSLCVALANSYFNSKNLQISFKLLMQGYKYHKLRKTFGKFFRSYSDLFSKFGEILFQGYGLLRWSSLKTKKGQIWSEFRLVGL